MKHWRCKACGQVFEDMTGRGPPMRHGVLLVRILEPAIDEPCNGTLEEIPDDWEKNIRRLENAG